MKLRPITDAMRAVVRGWFNPFKPNPYVLAETYMKTGDRVHSVGDKEVMAAASNLEAAYCMSETLPHDAMIALTMSRTELHAFVCYMRQLDATYRDQAQFIKRHIKPTESRGEFKTSEEAAEISAERYSQLTGEGYGDASHRRASELFEDAERHLQVAKRKLRIGGTP